MQGGRVCAACREKRSRDFLLRFVTTGDGGLALDLERVAPGRGLNIDARLSCLTKAVERGIFRRYFKGRGASVTVDAL